MGEGWKGQQCIGVVRAVEVGMGSDRYGEDWKGMEWAGKDRIGMGWSGR